MGEVPESPTDARSLAASLCPHLTDQCAADHGGYLGPIEWFKTDWQRGGAATGRSTWRDADHGDDDRGCAVVVKLPVVQRELNWLRRLQGCSVVPRVFAGGSELNGYDLAWVVMEHFPHGPLGQHWDDGVVHRCAEAIARFHQATADHPLTDAGRVEDWHALMERGVEAIHTSHPQGDSDWAHALKRLAKRLDDYVAEWRDRPINTWIHGDAHLANAMTRTGADDADVCLIDLAEVRPGHWVEDAVYFERQLWSHPERVRATKPVRAVTRARKALGLPTAPGDARLAMLRRVLLAGTAPAFLRSEGHPAHLHACLQWLRTGMSQLK